MRKNFYMASIFYVVSVSGFLVLGMLDVFSKDKGDSLSAKAVQPVLVKSSVEESKKSDTSSSQDKKKKYAPVAPKKDSKKASNDLWVIDKVLVRVNGINLKKSVLDEPQIAKDGGKYALKEAIEAELLYQKALEKQLLPSGADVQRQIVSLKMQRGLENMSDEEFGKELKESGFTLSMYKRQLGRLIAAENVKRLEIDDKIVITSQDVEEYYKKNPEYDKEAYNLKVSSLSNDEKDNYKKLIQEDKLTWKSFGWIEKDELDERYSFVSSMKKGDISDPKELKGKFVIVQLVDKKDRKLKPLTNSYPIIERRIREQRRQRYLNDFLKELEIKASIVYV